MSQLRPCKVIISGGGLAGLALALTLEKAGIDYQLLEAYPEIVPKVGSGICVVPNGLRILDQLGCYDDLTAFAHPVSTVGIRAPSGESLSSSDGWEMTYKERYGYPLRWIERSNIVRVIYGHIIDKSKILTGKRVQSVENTEDGVEITTTDGSIFYGDIIIGVDGVHSTVRREIQRHAAERNLGPEYTEQNDVPARYGCVYGMSPKLPGVPKACLEFRGNKGSSTLIGSGSEDRTFWFLYTDLGRTFRGPEIPKFNKEDLLKVVQEHWDECIMPGVKLSDLYESRKDAIFSAMPEFVFSKWHLDRMLILGDAAHQMTSIVAQGGSQALESISCFANMLIPALSDTSKTDRLSAEEISAVFERVQEIRVPRAQKIVAEAHQRQVMETMQTPELEEFMLNKFPKMMAGALIKRTDATCASGVMLNIFPIPKRLQMAQIKPALKEGPRL